MRDFEVNRRTVLTFVGGAVTGGGITTAVSSQPRSPANPVNDSTQNTTGNSDSGADSSSTSVTVDVDGHPIMGDSEAPITLVYYGDYGCPFTNRFEGGTLPSIESKYIYGSKDVKIVFKPLRPYGEPSLRAALASHAVWNQVGGDQYTFWAWHEALLSEQNDALGDEWAAMDSLVALSEGFDGIDGERLREQITSEARRLRIYDDEQEGFENGMTGTPYFLVYRDDKSAARKIHGAQPIGRFETIIESFR